MFVFVAHLANGREKHIPAADARHAFRVLSAYGIPESSVACLQLADGYPFEYVRDAYSTSRPVHTLAESMRALAEHHRPKRAS